MNNGHFSGWIGVDLDGTLAEYTDWKGPQDIGKPIQPMIDRVKAWIADGTKVRIMTARVFAPHDDAKRQREVAIAIISIQDWCQEHLDCILPITCVKDFGMIELWDDRCVQLRRNEGIPVVESL